MRWSVAVAIVAVLALLAGCLEQTAAPPVTADAPDEPPERTARGGRSRDRDDETRRSGNVTLHSYSDQFGVTLTSATAVLQLGSIQEYNCVQVTGAPYVIVNGTATLTWTSQSALTDTLDLEIRTYYTSAVYEHYSGTSPLVVEFKDLEIDDKDFEDSLMFGVQLTGPASAAYQQDVDLALAFDYESDIDVDAGLTYC